MSELLLAIPCFNEGKRLPHFLPKLLEALESFGDKVRIQIVDDGSDLEHAKELHSSVDSLKHAQLLPIITHPLNRGKGAAIQTAWKSSPDARLLAFIDADGSVSAEDARSMIGIALASDDAVRIASRAFPGKSKVERTPYRRLASWVFHTCAKLRYRIPIRDTQCGFKIAPNSFYRSHQDEFRQQRFAFDLELLLKAQAAGIPLIEHPVDWKEMPGGSLSFRAGLALIRDVLLKRI